MDAAGVLKEYIAIYAKVFSNITNTANSKNIADCWHSFLLASSRNVEDVFWEKFYTKSAKNFKSSICKCRVFVI